MLRQTLPRIDGYDVIPNRGVLIVSARDGLYQLDDRSGRLQRLSRLPVGAPVRSPPKVRIAIPPPAPGPPPKKKRPR